MKKKKWVARSRKSAATPCMIQPSTPHGINKQRRLPPTNQRHLMGDAGIASGMRCARVCSSPQDSKPKALLLCFDSKNKCCPLDNHDTFFGHL